MNNAVNKKIPSKKKKQPLKSTSIKGIALLYGFSGKSEKNFSDFAQKFQKSITLKRSSLEHLRSKLTKLCSTSQIDQILQITNNYQQKEEYKIFTLLQYIKETTINNHDVFDENKTLLNAVNLYDGYFNSLDEVKILYETHLKDKFEASNETIKNAFTYSLRKLLKFYFRAKAIIQEANYFCEKKYFYKTGELKMIQGQNKNKKNLIARDIYALRPTYNYTYLHSTYKIFFKKIIKMQKLLNSWLENASKDLKKNHNSLDCDAKVGQKRSYTKKAKENNQTKPYNTESSTCAINTNIITNENISNKKHLKQNEEKNYQIESVEAGFQSNSIDHDALPSTHSSTVISSPMDNRINKNPDNELC